MFESLSAHVSDERKQEPARTAAPNPGGTGRGERRDTQGPPTKRGGTRKGRDEWPVSQGRQKEGTEPDK